MTKTDLNRRSDDANDSLKAENRVLALKLDEARKTIAKLEAEIDARGRR